MPDIFDLEISSGMWISESTNLGIHTKTPSKKKAEEVPTTPLDAREGFTFGCDPEAFIKDANGRHVPVGDWLPGTKSHPYKVPGGAVQRDGVAAEFNIDPAPTFKEFNSNIEKVLRALNKMLPEGHTLDFETSAVTFDADVFDPLPEEHKELGCMPDINAWTGRANPIPIPSVERLRCIGGHLHAGWTKGAAMSDLQHILNCRDLVKQFDFHLGAWSVNHDPSTIRRSLYGKAGACRYKDYGVEYRVLSPFWVVSRERRLTVWNRMQRAISDLAETNFADCVGAGLNEQLISAINNGKLPYDLTKRLHYPILTLDTSQSRY